MAASALSCGTWDLVPWPEIEPGSPALGASSLSHWLPGRSPCCFLKCWCSPSSVFLGFIISFTPMDFILCYSSKRPIPFQKIRTPEKKEHLWTIDENINRALTMENSMKFPQKVKNRTNIWSSNSASGYIFKGNEKESQRNSFTPVFLEVLFTISKIWKQPNHQ